MRALLLGALAAVLISGCASQGATSPSQGGSQSPEDATQSPAPSTQVVRGQIGEPMDVGPSTIELVDVHKSPPNPEGYEGAFIVVEVDVTNERKQPAEMPTELSWYLHDSEGRSYAPDPMDGYAASYTQGDLKSIELVYDPINPGFTLHLVETYNVGTEPAPESYTFQGGDPICPQCSKLFKVQIPGDLEPSTPPSTSSASATASSSSVSSSASASASAQ